MENKKFYIRETIVWKIVMKILKYLAILFLIMIILLGICIATDSCKNKVVVNKEAAHIFVEKLKVLTKDKDVVDVDMREMVEGIEWDHTCWSYDRRGGFRFTLYKDILKIPGRTGIMNITDLILDKNVDAHSTLWKKVYKAPKGADFYHFSTSCMPSSKVDKNYKIRFRKVKGTEDQFIFEHRVPLN